MNVFNSLGSNYSLAFTAKALFGFGSSKKLEEFKNGLAEHYGVRAKNVALFYKGRQALEEAIRQAGLPPGSKIGINGFTCYVVYQAVEKAGHQPVLIDIAQNSLDFDGGNLADCLKEHDLKAIIIQNTLGLPQQIEAIEEYCKKHNIIIIEDLAHSFGAQYSGGREAGTVGDLAMLSFSQDKPMDAVAGGALIDRRKELAVKDLPRVSRRQRLINRLYPLFTLIIRGTYSIGLGRFIHFCLKKLHLLATPMSDNITEPYKIGVPATYLLSQRLQTFSNELEHRRMIADIYTRELPKALQIPPVTNSRPSYLRFPIRVNNRTGLVKHLKKSGIYIGDTWYDAPIGPARYLKNTNYKAGQCPNAEKLSAEIVNLPTHIHISPQKAGFICAKIRQCLETKR